MERSTSSYRNPPQKAEDINVALAEHQKLLVTSDWNLAAAMGDLHIWAKRFIFEFKIENTATPVLTIERAQSRIELGHYRCGRNGFGLRDEIAVNEEHVKACIISNSYWEVYGTLLHELLHLWQRYNGRPASPGSHNYHNKEFRVKAATFGLIVSHRGTQQYAPPPSPFWILLRKYGIEIPKIQEPIVRERKKGNSTLKLFQCPCGVKVRVGRTRFYAKCLDCGGLFDIDMR